jgi:hypothetical protein
MVIPDDYMFIYGNRNADHLLGTGFFVYEGITSAFQRVEVGSIWMLYIMQEAVCVILLF